MPESERNHEIEKSFEEIARDLSHSETFRGMSYEKLLNLVQTGEIKDFRDGEYLIRQDDPVKEPKKASIVLNGKAKVIQKGLIGDLATLDETGEIFGEMGIINGGVRSASVMAMGPVRVLVVDSDKIQHLFARSTAKKVQMTSRALAESTQGMAHYEQEYKTATVKNAELKKENAELRLENEEIKKENAELIQLIAQFKKIFDATRKGVVFISRELDSFKI